jgi:hypothetical protein
MCPILPEDGSAGSKHVGDFYEQRLYIFWCISWCLLFRMIQCTDMEYIKYLSRYNTADIEIFKTLKF